MCAHRVLLPYPVSPNLKPTRQVSFFHILFRRQCFISNACSVLTESRQHHSQLHGRASPPAAWCCRGVSYTDFASYWPYPRTAPRIVGVVRHDRPQLLVLYARPPGTSRTMDSRQGTADALCASDGHSPAYGPVAYNGPCFALNAACFALG